MSSGGKGSAAGGSKSYNYYGTIAAAWHVGQMDVLTGIEVDEKLLWSGALSRSTSANPVEITVPGRGIYRHYWGTSDQVTGDAKLSSGGNSNGHNHPAYRNICYGIFDDFLFGQERTQAPTVAIRGKRAPVQSLITGSAALLVDGQANIFCLLAELLTNPVFGLEMSTELFAASSWQAAADKAAVNPSLTYISPFLDSQVSVRALTSDLFVMCDGFLRAESGTGLCEAGMFAAPEEIDWESLLVIDKNTLVADPEFSPETWDDVQTTWTVRFRDRFYNFKKRSLRHDDPGALQRVGEIRTADLQRDFVVRSDQALGHAREWGRRNSTPGMKAALPVRAEPYVDLRPGGHVIANVNPDPASDPVNKICRVIELTRSVKGQTKIKVEAVRTLAPVASVAAPAAPVDPVDSVACVSHARVFEVPYGFDDSSYQVGILASRPDELVTDFRVLYDDTEDGNFPELGGSRAYALRGKVGEALTDTDEGPFQIELLDTIGRDLVAEGPGSVAAGDDALLMFIFKTSGDQIMEDSAGQAYMEIFSCSDFSADGEDTILVDALRARRGTYKRSFAADDEVWFIRRSSLALFEHSSFEGQAEGASTVYFQLLPGSISGQAEACGTLPFKFPPNRPKPPGNLNDLVPRPTLLPGGASFAAYCKTQGGTYGLVGFDQFVGTSSPPKRWLTKTASGHIRDVRTGYWVDPPCSEGTGPGYDQSDRYPVGSDVYDPSTGILTTGISGVNNSPELMFGPVSSTLRNISIVPTEWTCTGNEVCVGYESMGINAKWSGEAKLMLLDEDTDEAAIQRLKDTFDWDEAEWGLCTGSENDACCSAHWEDRTDSVTAAYQEGKYRLVAGGYFPEWAYTIKVKVFRRAYGTSDPWVNYSTLSFSADTNGTGVIDEVIEVPNERGWSTYIGVPSIGL